MKRIRLWIEVDVDPELLVAAGDELCESAWGSSIADLAGDLPIEVQAFFEVVLGSTPGPHPDWLRAEMYEGINYGGEIVAERREQEVRHGEV
jgi:hypothetical protein